MSTARQIAAYREILAKRQKEHQINAYGMVPFSARFPGNCGCGKTWDVPDAFGKRGVRCAFNTRDKIIKFRGAWWNVACVERVKQEEFRASARFVMEESWTRKDGSVRWDAKGWTNDPEEAARWRRNLCDDERVIERNEETITA